MPLSASAAAAATLRSRAAVADTDTPEDADEMGRRTILDLKEDESAKRMDFAPGSDIGELADERRYRVMTDRENWFRIVIGQEEVARIIPNEEEGMTLQAPRPFQEDLVFKLGIEKTRTLYH